MSSFLEELGGRFLQEALGFGVGTAISEPLRPFVEELAQEAWKLQPSRAVDPEVLATMAVQGVMSEAAAADEAALSGINGDRFHRLFLVNGDPIAPEQALDLWNRGEIKEADVNRALLQSRLKPEWVNTFKLLRRQILQVADLAQMVVQGVMPIAEAEKRAAMVGVDAADFGRLVRLSGNPPGPETMLALWNRGKVDEAGVDRALLQSRLKPEWVELFKQSRIRPASTAEAVAAVIKERIPMARGIEIAAENGTDEQTFRMLVDEGGRPIGIGQALTLVRRGDMTIAEFRDVVARSDVKVEFTDHLLQLQTVYPSLAQMRAIIGTGAMRDADAKEILHKLGYTNVVVEGIVAAGHGTKLAGTRALTSAAIVDAYKSQQIDNAQAVRLLVSLGYDENDVALILGYADYEVQKRYRDAVIAVVKARYLQGDIDQPTASGLLDKVGLPQAERDQYLELWTFDAQANPTLLTLAQLVSVLNAKIIDLAQFAAYLPRLRYQEPEISWLVQLHS